MIDSNLPTSYSVNIKKRIICMIMCLSVTETTSVRIYLHYLHHIFHDFTFINKLVVTNYIYIKNQIVVYSVNEKTNLHIDLKNLILKNICLV